MKIEKKEPTKEEDLTPEKIKSRKRSLTKNAVEVKAPKDTLLQGKEASKRKERGKITKGEFNWRLNPRDPLILK